MTIYNVYYNFEVDGGFGDAVDNKILVVSFVEEDDAKEFVKKYSNPHPNKYNPDFTEGELTYEKSELVLHKDFDLSKDFGVSKF